jgi:hypothetical protein
VAAKGLLGEHQLTVDDDLEDAIRTRDEFDFRTWEGCFDLRRRTGGPRFVVSDCAILDRHPHRSSTNGKFINLNGGAHVQNIRRAIHWFQVTSGTTANETEKSLVPPLVERDH